MRIQTSATHPLRVDFIDNDVLHGTGALGITIAPGKQGPSSFGGCWRRDLDADLARLRHVYRSTVIVSLMRRDERHALGIRGYSAAARRHGLRLIQFPVTDGGIPEAARLTSLIEDLDGRLNRGERIVIHCRGGLGRSGMVAACMLVNRGNRASAAIRSVRQVRPGAIESAGQERVVSAFSTPKSELLRALSRLQSGPAKRLGALGVVPLYQPGPSPDPAFVLAPSAISSGALRVTELATPSVNALEARNDSATTVLLLEGETLIGCRQNRVVTRSVLVAPGASMQIPVACMEEGRWSPVSASFSSGGMRMETAVRRATVHERAAAGNGHVDQSRMWLQVRERLARAGVHSSTRDYGAVVRQLTAPATTDLGPVPGQVGALLGHGNQLIALELCSHPAMWRELSPRALPAHLVDAGQMPVRRGSVSLRECLDRLASSTLNAGPALGLGTDLAVSGDSLLGTGLSWRAQMAHLTIFGC